MEFIDILQTILLFQIKSKSKLPIKLKKSANICQINKVQPNENAKDPKEKIELRMLM